ncbi:plasmid transfer protein TraB [Streptomyces sp. WAC05950]|uniref:plasmid transfer protein TraB n=1 Tax=Streptomyces sp. WAC05950 TaxID=2487419 RepID=UPI000F738716|nr:plasmid transfer protein TraB [Streptomyces sp. WAC05950]RST13471.1 sporulation protein SsgA [Streptomyces sp. WAC05950]
MAGKDIEQRHEDQLKGSADGGGIKGYLLHRAKPYLPPWLGVGTVGITGGAANLVWQGEPGMGVLLTLGSVALTGSTWWAARTTGKERRLHSAITVAAGSSWFTSAAIFGPAWDMWFVGGIVTALSWNIRQVMRRDPDGAKASAADGGLLDKVGLAKARMRDAKVEPNRVTVPLELEAGEQTNDDVARSLPRIASALDLPTTAIRYSPDPDSARRGELVIVPMDMLSEILLWEGPALPGGSIADPLVVGRYDNGDPLQLWLPADVEAARNGTHLLIAGMSGSGKGDGALNVLTEILSRKDVVVWLSDPKAFQDFRPLLPGIDWAVEAGAGTEAMVEAVQAVIPARTRWLGSHKYRAWEPSCAGPQNDPAHSCREDGPCGCEGMPFLVTWFEEAANTLRALGDDAFTGIAQEARSAGVSLVVSLQRPSHDQMSTSTRASLPSVLCFGVDKRDEGFALPDTVLDAGAHPGVWGNRRPGYCYLVTPGVDETLYASPARTRRFTWDSVSLMETLAAWAARNGAKPDPVTAGAAAAVVGKAYTERAQHREENPGDEEDEETTVSRLDDEDLDIDPNEELPQPLPGEENVIFDQGDGAELSREEARAALQEILAEFENEGTMVIGVKDVMDHAERFGRKRAWVSGELQTLLKEGRLAETSKPGRYRIVPAMADA